MADSDRFICAANRDAWALGIQVKNGFHVRKIVWGRALAREERRDGESIIRGRIMVKPMNRGRIRSNG